LRTLAATRFALNPATWWWFSIALVVVCTASANIIVLATVAVASIATVSLISARLVGEAKNQNQRSQRFYLQLAALVLLIRVGFRVVFNLGFNSADTILVELPRLAINLGVGHLEILGPITAQNLLAGATDGLRLAAIILAISMANIMANPRHLLKTMPGALFEIASTISVALNLAPQLIDSLQRVRRARRLRGRSSGLAALPSLVIPVLEDTLERSLALAASLDSRGFGRSTANRHPALARTASLLAVALIGIGSYTLLADAANSWIAWVLLAAGAIALVAALSLSSTRGQRSVYNKASWMPTDFALLAFSVALVGLSWWAHFSWFTSNLWGAP
jgi:energy-coupling factor transport system permease protein